MTIIRVIDFESSHDNPVDGGLVEIGYVDIEAKSIDLAGSPCGWEVIGGKGRLCHPGCAIPPETQAIHGIDDEDVVSEPNWKSLLGGLIRRGPSDGVIAYAAYGADMELKFLHPDWLGNPQPPMIDVYKVGLRVWGEKAPHHSNRALQYWRKPIGLKREDALPHHRAYQDALATAYLLRDLLNDEEAEFGKMVEWSELPALTVKCYLGDYRNDGKGTPWSEVETSMLEWIVDKGFHDKPDIRFTAEYHLRKREEEAAAEREREDLNRQLEANCLATVNADGTDNPLVDANQGILLL